MYEGTCYFCNNLRPKARRPLDQGAIILVYGDDLFCVHFTLLLSILPQTQNAIWNADSSAHPLTPVRPIILWVPQVLYGQSPARLSDPSHPTPLLPAIHSDLNASAWAPLPTALTSLTSTHPPVNNWDVTSLMASLVPQSKLCSLANPLLTPCHFSLRCSSHFIIMYLSI